LARKPGSEREFIYQNHPRLRGEIPSAKVYEDDRVLAFLDINPINPGHTLVIPKVEVDHLWDLAADDYAYLMATAKKLALHIRTVLKAPRIGMTVEGFAIPHAHVHLIPIYEGFVATLTKPKTDQNTPEALATMAKRLRLEA
jgi:histidine triad (HIT) family protein